MAFGTCCFLLTLAPLLAVHFHPVFHQALAETGDFAVNALQIANAKRLNETLGNYSRWGFHHPGPAFFYVYAAGESLFYDWMGLVPAPGNAHVLIGIALQCLCLALSLVILRDLSSGLSWRRVLLVASFGFGLGHFYLARDTFLSIWPPHQLVQPFLLMNVAAIAVFMGRGAWLPVLVLAGSFCVHGHVAMPLFVLPTVFVAVIGLLFHAPAAGWIEPGSLSRRVAALARKPAVTVSVLLGTAMALPIICDIAAGSQSNFHTILKHLQTHQGEHKSFGQALRYLLLFPSYPDHHHQPPGSLAALLRRAPMAYAGWACVFSGVLAGLWLRGRALWRGSVRGPDPFLSLGLFLVLQSALAFAWAARMHGEAFAFNAQTNFAVLWLWLAGFLLLPCLYVNALPAPRAAVAALAGLCAIASAAVALPHTRIMSFSAGIDPAGPGRIVRASQAQGARLVVLTFEHSSWPDAAAAAIALERAGIGFAVSPEWAFMFGKRRSIDKLLSQPDLRWHVAPGGSPEPGVITIGGSKARAIP